MRHSLSSCRAPEMLHQFWLMNLLHTQAKLFFAILLLRLIKVPEVQNGGEPGVLAARVLGEVQAALSVVQLRIAGTASKQIT